MDQALIQYYLKELAQIEDDCAEFAVMHPQVAGRLTLSTEGATDPHVRQLIESVAFISSRLKLHMDGLSGEIIYALLQLLSPNLTRPVPSMAIARFTPSRSGLEMIGTEVPRGGLLQGVTDQNESCMLSAPLGATLWPLQVQSFWAGKNGESRNQILAEGDENCFVIRVSSDAKKIKAGSIQSLNFFISGPLNRAMAAIEAFVLGVREVHVVAPDGSWRVRLPTSAIKAVGFGGPEERLVPTPSMGENLGNLVLEYLLFPQRFCFFRVDGLECLSTCAAFDIVFVLDSKAVARIDAVKSNITINCLPIINLYSRLSVPIGLPLHQHQSECLIPADPSHKGRWDVYSIDRVRVIGKGAEFKVPEYFSSLVQADAHPLYWVESRREQIGGTSSYASAVLGFVDEERHASSRAWDGGDVVLVDINCTNGHVPELLTSGQALDTSLLFSHYKAAIEVAASQYVEPTLPQATKMGRLLAAFSFRTGAPDVQATATATVRNYLKVHARGKTAFAEVQINGLRQIDRTLVAMPLQFATGGNELGAGFRYDVRFHDNNQMDGGRYFFGKIVKALMSQVCGINISQEVWVHDAVWGSILVE